jgi:dTDP-4-amino-4,6-dideoxygalactose transaminase
VSAVSAERAAAAAEEPIPQLDLRAQYRAIAAEVEAAVLAVLRSGQYVLGETVARFERAMEAALGVRHAIAVASGSDALLLALMALDVGPGDEVVTSPFSFFATVAAIVRLGAVPVFADVAPDDLLLDPEAARAVCTERTRALLPVHLYGQCVDLRAFDAIARERRIAIVEDAAQAVAASRDGIRAGAWGDVACFSFYPTKNLGAAGDAGLLTTGDDRVAERLRRLRVHGSATRYEHAELGINSRMDAVQAAILHAKLPHLDAWTEARIARAAIYDELFAAARLDAVLRLPHVHPGARHVFHQYVVRAPRRDELRAHLQRAEIGSEIYYPIPLHLQQCFAPLGYKRGELPESERAAADVLALPLYPELTRAQQERVVGTIAAFYGVNR